MKDNLKGVGAILLVVLVVLAISLDLDLRVVSNYEDVGSDITADTIRVHVVINDYKAIDLGSGFWVYGPGDTVYNHEEVLRRVVMRLTEELEECRDWHRD